MQCGDCRYWRGNKYSKVSDCYRVIFSLEPKLLNCTTTIGEVEGIPIWVPFDPHDISYFNMNSQLKHWIKKLKKKLPKGVQVETLNGVDYFMTNRDYYCEFYKELK